MANLQRGSKGRSVRAVQEALCEAGHEVDVDGDFGANTEKAVRAFQRKNDLEVDGIVGPDTLAALGFEEEEEDDEEEDEADEDEKASDDEEEDEEELPTLSRGAQGDAVVDLQEALVDLGYDLEQDGIFGPDTEKAVRAFQRKNDLEVDGIVGPDTWAALGFE